MYYCITLNLVRGELLLIQGDHTLFNKYDLENKLEAFRKYYNETRVNSSLTSKTPAMKANETNLDKNQVPLDKHSWQPHRNCLYQFTVKT